MMKSHPAWLGPGFELGISQIRVQGTRWRSFCFVEYHHVKDFAQFLIFTLI